MMIGNIVVFILALILAYSIVMYIKIDVTYRNCSILLEAVHLHNLDIIKSLDYETDKKYLIDYEKYLGDNVMTRALFKFFDWGYTNILPKDIYERIVPYLDEATRNFDNKHKKIL